MRALERNEKWNSISQGTFFQVLNPSPAFHKFSAGASSEVADAAGNILAPGGIEMKDSYMPNATYPLAVPDDLVREVRAAAKETGLTMAEAMRQSMRLGLAIAGL
jgi:hypothetical protein